MGATPPVRYIVPQGYSGWLRLDYQVKGAKPLPLVNNCILVKFSKTGRLKTSSAKVTGWSAFEYYYESRSGQLQRLQGQPNTILGKGAVMVWGEGGGGKFRIFFVGTRDQFEQCGAYPH